MKRDGLFALMITAVAVLAACESSPTPPPRAAAPAPAPAPAAPPPPAVATGPISLPPIAPTSRDSCGADLLADLIGKPRTAIPVPVDPSSRRVVCTNCPRTMDFRPDRQTIEYNPDTGIVTSVSCG